MKNNTKYKLILSLVLATLELQLTPVFANPIDIEINRIFQDFKSSISQTCFSSISDSSEYSSCQNKINAFDAEVSNLNRLIKITYQSKITFSQEMALKLSKLYASLGSIYGGYEISYLENIPTPYFPPTEQNLQWADRWLSEALLQLVSTPVVAQKETMSGNTGKSVRSFGFIQTLWRRGGVRVELRTRHNRSPISYSRYYEETTPLLMEVFSAANALMNLGNYSTLDWSSDPGISDLSAVYQYLAQKSVFYTRNDLLKIQVMNHLPSAEPEVVNQLFLAEIKKKLFNSIAQLTSQVRNQEASSRALLGIP